VLETATAVEQYRINELSLKCFGTSESQLNKNKEKFYSYMNWKNCPSSPFRADKLLLEAYLCF